MDNTKKNELDILAKSYHLNNKVDDLFIEKLNQIYFFNWLIKNFKKTEKVLEMGYGDGVITDNLAKEDINLTVVEGSSVLVEKARKKYPNINFINSLFEEIDINEKYETILALHVLEHVDEPVRVLNHIKKILKPNGRIIIEVPNSESVHRKLALIMGLHKSLDTLSKRDLMVGHKRVYSHDLLKRHLSEAGLVETFSRGFFLKVIPNSMMLSFNKELLFSFNKISDDLPLDICANIVSIAKLN